MIISQCVTPCNDLQRQSFDYAGLCQTNTHWRWHLDEVYVKINGETHYLWREVDQEGEVLESFVTKTRDKAAALAFIKKALKRHGSPKKITTDGLRSYGPQLGDRAIAKLLSWLENRMTLMRWIFVHGSRSADPRLNA